METIIQYTKCNTCGAHNIGELVDRCELCGSLDVVWEFPEPKSEAAAPIGDA